MATLREVRTRIGGVKKTQKITRAMKMVAAAKLRHAQIALMSARPYADGMKDLLQQLLPLVEPGSEPLLVPRPLQRLGIVVVTSDRGMCGAFNTNVIRAAQAHMDVVMSGHQATGSVRLFLIGKKSVDFFTKRAFSIAARHPGFFNQLTFAEAASVAREVIDSYLQGEIDRVDLVYNEFKSASQQQIVIAQYLPLVPEVSQAEAPARPTDYIYEPSKQALLSALVPRYLNFFLWRVLLESDASEQGARMVAMENATENARELIETLQLQYNKARQAAITKELLEVVSGAEAQAGAS